MDLKSIHSFRLNIFSNRIFKWLFFIPIFFNFCQRSYMAQDEGYYALQARWILESSNWLAPQWWGQALFDRTIAIQWLIASAQQLFGKSIFAAHLPSLISAFICLLLINNISRIFIAGSLYRASIFILSSTYLWVNYTHLATQDMPLLALELIGLFSIIKSIKSEKIIYKFLSGVWIGLAFFLKTVMVLIPLLALLPIIFLYKKKFFSHHYFLLGIVIGFLPFCLWIVLSLHEYGFKSVSMLWEKVFYLSDSDDFSRPFTYYIWNIPANTFPWSIFAIFGFIRVSKEGIFDKVYILVIYPLIILILLSIFKTKTPYYALQLTPFIAINANIGLQYILSNRGKKQVFIKSISKAGILLLIASLSTFLYSVFFSDLNREPLIFLLCLFALIIGLSWICTLRVSSINQIILLTILGPFLSFCLACQFGLLTNRDPFLKDAYVTDDSLNLLHSQKTYFLIPSSLTSDAFSRLVNLALYTPNLGSSIETISDLTPGDIFWIHESQLTYVEENKLTQITSNDKFNPWVLVRRD